MGKTHCVYMHKFPNGKVYIGICKCRKARWNNGKGYSNQKKVYEAIVKYGWDNIEHIIIKENITEKEAKMLEALLLDYYNAYYDGYNDRYEYPLCKIYDEYINYLKNMTHNSYVEILFLLNHTKITDKDKKLYRDELMYNFYENLKKLQTKTDKFLRLTYSEKVEIYKNIIKCNIALSNLTNENIDIGITFQDVYRMAVSYQTLYTAFSKWCDKVCKEIYQEKLIEVEKLLIGKGIIYDHQYN